MVVMNIIIIIYLYKLSDVRGDTKGNFTNIAAYMGMFIQKMLYSNPKQKGI